MNTINIGLFIDTFYPMIDGVIMVVDNYAKRLSEYANVYVFAPKIPGEKYDDTKFNYKVIRCKSLDISFIDYSLPLPDLDRNFKKQLGEIKLDIVHIHSPATLGSLGIKYAQKNNIPVIATMHSQYRQDFYRATKSKFLSDILTKHIIRLFDKCDECWTLNQDVAKIFHEEYGYKTIPRIINNATDMEPVKDINKAKDKINKLHNLNLDEKVFLFVGRINKLKNIDLIVESLSKIKNINYKMLFVGTGQDEEYLRKLIEKCDLSDKIIMCGRVSDRSLLADYYARADLFLFPSLYDSNSLVQLEAASQSTPTLFVEGAATASKVTGDVDGYFAKNEASDYANKIEVIMSDEKKYQEVCKNTFKNLYINWDDEVKRVYSSYLRLIESRKK